MRRTAVVTGCSYGLGLEIVNQLIGEGYYVYGLSRSNPPINLGAYPDTFTWVECDITNSDEVKTAFKHIGTYIDVLVNNAGVFEFGSFEQFTHKKIDNIIDVNVKGTMYVTSSALDYMNDGSKIIFINSVAGLYEIDNEAVYSASKHAITAFAGILGKELRDRKIKVISIHPGGMETPMQRTNPNKQTLIDPKEIANMLITVIKSKAIYKTIKVFPESEWHQ